MTSSAHDAGSSDFETLARQYFGAWGDALRHATTPGAPAGDDPGSWKRLFDWWGQLLPEQGQAAPEDAVRRFREQAGSWYGTMQEVAARFAGRDASSTDVAQAWREAVQGQGDGMLQWMLQGARGSTQAGAAVPEFAAWLQQFQMQAGPWLQSPAFGPGREHQARWQALLRTQEEYQQHSRAYVDQIKQALDEAFTLFEQRLAEHEQPGSQLTSARAMFDLWIEVAEEAYAKVAMSEPFQQVYAALGNAQMRLRAGLQREGRRAPPHRRAGAQPAPPAGTGGGAGWNRRGGSGGTASASEGEAGRAQGREEGCAGKEGRCEKGACEKGCTSHFHADA